MINCNKGGVGGGEKVIWTCDGGGGGVVVRICCVVVIIMRIMTRCRSTRASRGSPRWPQRLFVGKFPQHKRGVCAADSGQHLAADEKACARNDARVDFGFLKRKNGQNFDISTLKFRNDVSKCQF